MSTINISDLIGRWSLIAFANKVVTKFRPEQAQSADRCSTRIQPQAIPLVVEHSGASVTFKDTPEARVVQGLTRAMATKLGFTGGTALRYDPRSRNYFVTAYRTPNGDETSAFLSQAEIDAVLAQEQAK